MRKEYRTDSGYSVRKLGREKQIYFTASGEPYFIHNGRRYHLTAVDRFPTPVLYEKDGELFPIQGGVVCGYIYYPLVQICSDNEHLQLFETVNNEEV